LHGQANIKETVLCPYFCNCYGITLLNNFLMCVYFRAWILCLDFFRLALEAKAQGNQCCYFPKLVNVRATFSDLTEKLRDALLPVS
jgi:hypothetical protein